LNRTIYIPGGVHVPNSTLSLFDWMLHKTESLHSLVRRYKSPDEYPFFPDALLQPILPPLHYPRILHPNDVNVNEKLKKSYIEHILPAACTQYGREERGEAQENFGSAATCDVVCLQALSRRIHFGKFVAESKFQAETARFVALIKSEDREGIDVAITDAKVEKKVLERLRLKAMKYGTDPSIPANGPVKIDAAAVVSMYKDYVIPLTKEVEGNTLCSDCATPNGKMPKVIEYLPKINSHIKSSTRFRGPYAILLCLITLQNSTSKLF